MFTFFIAQTTAVLLRMQISNQLSHLLKQHFVTLIRISNKLASEHFEVWAQMVEILSHY